MIGTFARFLVTQERPPHDLCDITPAMWHQWRVSRPTGEIGRRQILKVGAFLRTDPRLPTATRQATLKRVTKTPRTETAYTPEQFAAIKTAATQNIRKAWQRIRANRQHLADWRNGRFTDNSPEDLLGQALNHLASTGDVPLDPQKAAAGYRVVQPQYLAILGGKDPESSWRRLYLTNVEVVSLAALMVISYGWNSTPITELNVPEAMSDLETGHVIYRVELAKRRRKLPLRYETRNLTDWGPTSPGRLIAQAIEATAPARDLLKEHDAPTSRLLLWHLQRPVLVSDRTALIRAGFGAEDIRHWHTVTGITAMNMRRLRRTVTALHRRTPTQHSQDVHDSIYVLPEPATRDTAAPVIADGVNHALAHAKAVVTARISTHNSDAPPNADTATVSCSDHLHSPFSAHGTPCRASFLLCLACTNAVVTPRHLPRLAYLHRALDELRAALPAKVWDHDWREHFARLCTLKESVFTTAEWIDALTAAGAEDRAVIEALLHREFDQ
ncbi:hypothetical protein [Mycobacterium branderi]|uniref:hypothetical protein n=1 Tax=Mycobacterium branderi TaxID=43348 RepID=UPI00111BEB4B|nr:hypothetical protein [Mycobacterium branderi]MCV7236407.1 hypothetical protein [Mycobacterium branderi]